MAEVSRIQIFENGGTSEDQNILALPPMFSDEGSENVRLVKTGQITVLDGWEQVNATPLVSTGGQALRMLGLFQYKKTDGSFTSWVVVGEDIFDETEVWHSTDDGATWTRLVNFPISTANTVVDMAQLGDDLQIVWQDASIVPQTYDGATVLPTGQTQPPALTVAETSVVGVLQGIYQYKQADIDDEGIVGPASPASPAQSIDDLRNLVSSIQVPTPPSTATRIFRTTGDGGVFYVVVDLTDGETEYEDNLDDRTLLSRQAEIINAGDPPPIETRFVEDHRARQFYADETTIYPSDLNLGQSVPLSNSFQVGEGQQGGDPIVGMSGDYRGELIIWKEHSVYRLSGSGRQTWNLIRTSASEGTPTHRSAVLVPAGAKYTDDQGMTSTITPSYAYFSSDNKLRLFDGDSDVVISDSIQDAVAASYYDFRRAVVGVHVPSYDWVVWWLPTGFGSEFATVAWDYGHGVMHANAAPALPNLATPWLGDSATDNEFIMAGTAFIDGLMWRIFNGTTNGGAARTATLRLKPFDAGVPGVQKTMRDIETYHDGITGAQTSLKVNIYEGFTSAGAGTPFVTLNYDNLANPAGTALVSTGQTELQNDFARYPVQMAFVVEVKYEGEDQWSFLGFTPGVQPYSAAPARTRTA